MQYGATYAAALYNVPFRLNDLSALMYVLGFLFGSPTMCAMNVPTDGMGGGVERFVSTTSEVHVTRFIYTIACTIYTL